MQGQNLRFMEDRKKPLQQARVGFLLLEHFSLPAYTQALDTMVTANLINPDCFATESFSLSGESVTSDLGLVICPDAQLQLPHLA